MYYRILTTLLLTVSLLMVPLTASAVFFPGGIDWTNPSQTRFVQSLYLNMLGRAPDATESRDAVRSLRRNDNRTSRLRVFESLLQSAEYQRTFDDNDNSWQVFQAPDYNYNNGSGYVRYQAAETAPQGFTDLPRGGRSFTRSIARSVAHYYNAYCYRGEPCINNPELAYERGAAVIAQNNDRDAHACADPSNLNSQFKWVAVNGTTYPRGVNSDTICLDNAYYKATQLDLQRYDCDTGYLNCRRNRDRDLRATRSGTDNSGHAALFFRDGSRLALIESDNAQSIDSAGVVTSNETDPLLVGDAHDCADPQKTTSRFTWLGTNRTAESVGIGGNIVCMDNYYYAVQGMTLYRHNCRAGFIDCQPDQANNLTAERRTRLNGNPGLVFANGTTLSITARNLAPATTATPPATTATRDSSTRQQNYRGTDCADAQKRLSQFRWKSNGLSSWPDGVNGRFICLNDTFYEVDQNQLRNYSCQRNFTNCIANPGKDIAITGVSQDGMVWNLGNGDQVTLISK